MNRELKVPAALAIMLVGFGAMVFWCGKPQDDPTDDAAPPDFSDIDAELRSRPHAPHLTGLESHSVTESAGDEKSAAKHVADSDAAAKPKNDGWFNWLRDTDSRDADLVSDRQPAAPAERSRERKVITSRPVDDFPSLGDANDDFDIGGDDFLLDRDEELYGEAHGSPADVHVPAPIVTTPSQPVPVEERHHPHNDAWEPVTSTPVGHKSSATTPREPWSSPRTYVIQPGDTLSRIADRFMGGSQYANEIFHANREVLSNPNQLSVGTEIVIPRRAEPAKQQTISPDGPVADNWDNDRAAPASRSGSLFRPVSSGPLRGSVRTTADESSTDSSSQTPREYTVVPGDSLERIAVRIYGSRRKALDIYRANADRLSSPDAIRAGMTLTLP